MGSQIFIIHPQIVIHDDPVRVQVRESDNRRSVVLQQMREQFQDVNHGEIDVERVEPGKVGRPKDGAMIGSLPIDEVA